jgi:predicted nucleotidyltransferase
MTTVGNRGVVFRQIFSEIQALKRELLPNGQMFLFGSQARGDAHEDSDWDLLVVIDKDRRNFAEDFDKYCYPFSEIGDRHGTHIDVIVQIKKEWETRPSMLKYNVEQDGIEII